MGELVSRGVRCTALLIGLAMLAACSPAPLAQPSWPAPSDPMARAEAAGLEPSEVEHLVTHLHAHLDVFVDGERVVVPSGIGIDIASPSGIDDRLSEDGTQTEYFVTECGEPCLSPLHTHNATGVVHTESINPNQEPYTLGQFFTEWGVRLDGSCVGEFCAPETSVAVYLDGERYSGNPAEIRLTGHLEVAVVIGQPPERIPDSWPFLPGE